jgi:hypothetical protein
MVSTWLPGSMIAEVVRGYDQASAFPPDWPTLTADPGWFQEERQPRPLDQQGGRDTVEIGIGAGSLRDR